MANFMYYMAPQIVKETNRGLDRYTIQDEMLRHREVECLTEIDEESAAVLIDQLRYLHREDPRAEITMYINSPGGEVTSGMALFDVMKAVNCPIRTVCIGLAASMGAVLFEAGTTREIMKHGRVMIHDPLKAGKISASALQLQSMSESLMSTRRMIAEILAGATGKTVEEIYEKTKADTYFDAEEAIAFGLADRIIEKI